MRSLLFSFTSLCMHHILQMATENAWQRQGKQQRLQVSFPWAEQVLRQVSDTQAEACSLMQQRENVGHMKYTPRVMERPDRPSLFSFESD